MPTPQPFLATFCHVAICSLLTLLIAPTALADKDPNELVEKGRWQGLARLSNLLTDEADADELIDAGDHERYSHQNRAGALAYYLIATRQDPTNALAPYFAARILALQEKDDLAVKHLDMARERGFWQLLIHQDHKDLDSLKHTEAYQKLTQAAESRYAENAVDAGEASLLIPKGKAPDGGWPVLVWLSGYGTEGSSDLDIYPKLDKEGHAIFVALNGTRKRDDHSFTWDLKAAEPTHKAVQAALKRLESDEPINRSRIALMGFSQGSEHAAQLLAQYPDDYIGALLLSPGGTGIPFQSSQASGKRVIIVQGDQESGLDSPMVQSIRKTFENGNEIQNHVFSGGHYFQDDWETVYPKHLDFIFNSKES